MRVRGFVPLVILLFWGGAVFADMVRLENGRRLQVHSYEIDGEFIHLNLNERSEMVVPLAWVREIRASPRLPESPKPMQSEFEYSTLVWSLSEKHQIDWRLVAAIMKIESNFNPRAVSPKGALGLMQLMPDTAKLYRVKDPYDPEQNIEGGIKHLKMLIGHYAGDLKLVLAAYNSGQKAVERFRGIPPFGETREYVKKVLRLYQTKS